MLYKVPSNPNHSVILFFKQSWSQQYSYNYYSHWTLQLDLLISTGELSDLQIFRSYGISFQLKRMNYYKCSLSKESPPSSVKVMCWQPLWDSGLYEALLKDPGIWARNKTTVHDNLKKPSFFSYPNWQWSWSLVNRYNKTSNIILRYCFISTYLQILLQTCNY